MSSRSTGSRRLHTPSPSTSVALAVSGASLSVLPVFMTGALSVQLGHALRLSSTGLGVMVAVFFGSSELSTLTLGTVAERVGGIRMMLAMAVVSILALALIGAEARSVATLAAFLALAGLANGGMQPAANLFLTERVGNRRQGLAFGIKQAGIPIATLLSGVAVPALALTVGWEAGYGAGAALGLVLLVALVRDRRRVPPGARLAPKPTETTSASAPSGGEALPEPPPRQRLEGGPLVVLACAMALAVSASNALGSFVVPSAVASGVSPGLAGAVSALGSFAGLSTRVALGWRADRDRNHPQSYRPPLRLVATMLAVGVLGYLALASGNVVALVPGVLVAYAAGWGWNGLFNLAVVRSHPHTPARATGLTQMGTYVGGACGPLLFGVLVDHGGYALAWGIAAVLALAGSLAMLTGRHLLTRRLHPEALG